MACCTEVIFSASSSGISIPNSSSNAITSSTVSSESAPRSSTNEASLVTSSSLTPSCSATIFLTRSSTVLIGLMSLTLCAHDRACRPGPPFYATDPPLATRTLSCRLFLKAFSAKKAFLCSCHVHPAIDVQGLAGDPGRVRPCQETDSCGDILWPTEPTERNLRREPLALRGRQRFGHVGVDETRRHDIHGDPARCYFARH